VFLYLHRGSFIGLFCAEDCEPMSCTTTSFASANRNRLQIAAQYNVGLMRQTHLLFLLILAASSEIGCTSVRLRSDGYFDVPLLLSMNARYVRERLGVPHEEVSPISDDDSGCYVYETAQCCIQIFWRARSKQIVEIDVSPLGKSEIMPTQLADFCHIDQRSSMYCVHTGYSCPGDRFSSLSIYPKALCPTNQPSGLR
jgi:hypothetical protein